MGASKEEDILDFLNNTCSEYNIDFRENAITLSYDFIIDTGTSKVIIKIGKERWENSDSITILSYLRSKEEKINQVLLTDESEIFSIK